MNKELSPEAIERIVEALVVMNEKALPSACSEEEPGSTCPQDVDEMIQFITDELPYGPVTIPMDDIREVWESRRKLWRDMAVVAKKAKCRIEINGNDLLITQDS